MDVTGPGKNARRDEKERNDRSEASPKPHARVPGPDDAAAQTQVNLVSPFAHPRGDKFATFNLRQFVTRHPIPVALSCLVLGGTIAAGILKRRRRDAWAARLDRLRHSFSDAANGAA
jgi:hypothetical protein